MSAENELSLLATAELKLRETNDPKDQDYADIIAGVLRLRGTDISCMVNQNSAPTLRTAERTLDLITIEYKADPINPVLLSEFNQAFWNAKRQVMGVSESDLVVTQCSGGQSRKFFPNDIGLFLPQVVSTAPDGLVLLSKAFPEIGDPVFRSGAVLNIDKDGNLVNLSGWMGTEKTINAPHLETNEDQAFAVISKNKRLAQTLNVYVAAGQQSKLLTDQYLDEVSTWVRVLSSRIDGKVVDAGFYPDGHCFVSWGLGSQGVLGGLGVRSVGV